MMTDKRYKRREEENRHYRETESKGNWRTGKKRGYNIDAPDRGKGKQAGRQAGSRVKRISWPLTCLRLSIAPCSPDIGNEADWEGDSSSMELLIESYRHKLHEEP
eukprot:762001-Hanusia_phi.AAC.1